jgi:hypothetical protein
VTKKTLILVFSDLRVFQISIFNDRYSIVSKVILSFFSSYLERTMSKKITTISHLAEVVSVKSLTPSQSVFLQKKPEFKDRFCELLEDQDEKTLTLNIYKIKANQKKNLYFTAVLNPDIKILTDDSDADYQMVLDQIPNYIFSFPNLISRSKWITTIVKVTEKLKSKVNDAKMAPGTPLKAPGPIPDVKEEPVPAIVLPSAVGTDTGTPGSKSTTSLRDQGSALSVDTDMNSRPPLPEEKEEKATTEEEIAEGSMKSQGPSRKPLPVTFQLGQDIAPIRRNSGRKSLGSSSKMLVQLPSDRPTPSTAIEFNSSTANDGISNLTLASPAKAFTNEEEQPAPPSTNYSMSSTKPKLNYQASHGNYDFPSSTYDKDRGGPASMDFRGQQQQQPSSTMSNYSPDVKSLRLNNNSYSGLGLGLGLGVPASNTPLQMSELLSSDKPTFTHKNSHASVVNTNNNESMLSILSFPHQNNHQKSSSSLSASLLNNKIEALTAMNEDLNAALERSELLRQEEVNSSLNEISRLRLILEDSMEEKNKLQEENQQVQALLDTIQSLEREKELLLVTKQSIADELHQLQQNQKDSSSQLDQLSNNNDKLLHDYSSQKTLIESLELETFHLKAGQTMKENEIHSLKAENLSLSEKIQLQTEEVSKLSSIVHDAEKAIKENKVFKDANAVFQEKIFLLSNENKKLQQDVSLSLLTEENYKITIQRLENLIKEQSLFIQEISDQLNKLKEFKQQNDEKSLELILKNDENMKLNLEKENLKKELERVMLTVNYFEKENKQKDLNYDELFSSKNKELSHVKDSLNQLQLEYDHLQNENTILQRRIELQKEEKLKLTSDETMSSRRYQLESQSLTTQVLSYKGHLETANETIFDWQRKFQNMEEEKLKLIYDLTTKVTHLEELNGTQKKTIHDLNQRIYHLDQTISSLQESLSHEKQSLLLLNQEIQEKEDKFHHEKNLLAKELQLLKESSEELKLKLIYKEKELTANENSRRESQDSLSVIVQEHIANNNNLKLLNTQYKIDLEKLNQDISLERKAYEERLSSNLALQHNLEMKLKEMEHSFATNLSEKNITLQNLSTSKNEMEIVLLEKNQNILLLTSEREHLTNKLSEVTRKFDVVTSTVQELQLNYDNLLKEKESILHTAQSKESKHENNVKECKKEISVLQFQNDSLTKENQELKSIQEEKEFLYNNRISTLEETLLTHSNLLKEKQALLVSLENTVKEKTIDLVNKDTAKEQLSMLFNEKEKIVDYLTAQLQEKDSLLQEKLTMIQNNSHLMENKEKEKIILESSISEKMRESQELKNQISYLSQELQSLKQINTDQDLELNETTAIITNLENEIVLLKSQTEKFKSLNEELNRSLANSLTSIQSLEENNRSEINYWSKHIQEMEEKFMQDKVTMSSIVLFISHPRFILGK